MNGVNKVNALQILESALSDHHSWRPLKSPPQMVLLQLPCSSASIEAEDPAVNGFAVTPGFTQKMEPFATKEIRGHQLRAG